MNNIIEEINEVIANIIFANLDREIKSFLDIYNLPFDRNELSLKGYHLIMEETGDLSEKKYKLLLCKVEDVKRFTIKTSLTPPIKSDVR